VDDPAGDRRLDTGRILPKAHRRPHGERRDVPGLARRKAIEIFALQWSDRETWGNVPDDAGYVHGLAIRRDFAGMGLGLEMLRRAEHMVYRVKRECLRLDCVADSEALNEYYRRAGFGYRGRAVVRGLAVSLYEKRVGVSGPG
jgi:ribosomal protein S18 acetylase RimI-like enzyme